MHTMQLQDPQGILLNYQMDINLSALPKFKIERDNNNIAPSRATASTVVNCRQQKKAKISYVAEGQLVDWEPADNYTPSQPAAKLFNLKSQIDNLTVQERDVLAKQFGAVEGEQDFPSA